MSSNKHYDIRENMSPKAYEAMRNLQVLLKPFAERKGRIKKPSNRHRERFKAQQVTPEFAATKEAELSNLRNEELNLVKQIGDSYEVSGRNENQDVENLTVQLDNLRNRILRLEDEIAAFEVISPTAEESTDVVTVGSEVTICTHYYFTDRTATFDTVILGQDLSTNSAIGKAILGKKVGDHMKVKLPDGDMVSVTIVAL